MSGDFSLLTKKIKDDEKRMADISELQKQIGTYGKICDVFSEPNTLLAKTTNRYNRILIFS